MVNTFFKQLKEHLETDLPWLDNVGSNVTYFKGQNGIVPISCFSEECKKNTGYLVPGNGAINIMFFEFLRSKKNLNDPCLEVNQIEFNLFFWFNCELIDVEIGGQEVDCCEKIDFLYNEIAKSLKKLGIFTIFTVDYNISAPYLTDKTTFYPYFNFKMKLGTTVTFNPCGNGDITVTPKVC